MSAISGKTDKNGRALPEYPGMRLALRLKEEGRRGPALDSDAPPLSTLPPHRPPKVHEGQLPLASAD